MLKVAVVLVGLGISLSSFAAQKPDGASFNEVWNVVTVAPEVTQENAADLALYGTSLNPTLPQYSSNIDIIKSIFNFSMVGAAKRTVNETVDYRPYFKKEVHANGICFAGVWEATEDSKFTGLFAKGATALMVGRVSAASPQTTNDDKRSFGFAGKLFPTLDPGLPVKTANFFTIQHLNGTDAAHVLDVAYVNEPPVDMSDIPIRILNWIFSFADINPGVRPLYPIAQAGLPVTASDVTPQWMRIRVAPTVQNPNVHDADFRNELSARNYPQGLIFTVEVSDTTKDPLAVSGWNKIAQIRTSAMTTTFGCDRRLHFAHAKSKNPRVVEISGAK
jgi:hypothetical protein